MIQVGDLRISLDKRESGSDLDFISHAHSDHVAAARKSKSVIASVQTKQLVECAYGLKPEIAQCPDNIKLIEAGHMLGSKQICVENRATGNKVVYSGDFSLSPSKTAKPIEVTSCDSLILDSTYYDPKFSFGDKEAAEREMVAWVKQMLDEGIVIFSAFKMGKAQELISIFNENGIVPVVSKKIGQISKVYQSNGIDLRYISAYDSNEGSYNTMSGNFVGITESRKLGELGSVLSKIHGKPVYTAVASGFAKIWDMGTDKQFVVSDHADFSQSLEYIKATGARHIYTYGVNNILFARNLSSEGCRAEPLTEGKKFE